MHYIVLTISRWVSLPYKNFVTMSQNLFHLPHENILYVEELEGDYKEDLQQVKKIACKHFNINQTELVLVDKFYYYEQGYSLQKERRLYQVKEIK